MQVPSAITTMPPEPMPEPTVARSSLSRRMRSTSSPVTTLVEMPPGMMAFTLRPPGTPPQVSKMNSRKGRPGSTSYTPGLLMCPEIDTRRVPGLFFVPVALKASAPWLMMPAMLESVSTLFTTVGFW
jgi:hypothetical protein